MHSSPGAEHAVLQVPCTQVAPIAQQSLSTLHGANSRAQQPDCPQVWLQQSESVVQSPPKPVQHMPLVHFSRQHSWSLVQLTSWGRQQVPTKHTAPVQQSASCPQ
jgi:hypothetical protein